MTYEFLYLNGHMEQMNTYMVDEDVHGKVTSKSIQHHASVKKPGLSEYLMDLENWDV